MKNYYFNKIIHTYVYNFIQIIIYSFSLITLNTESCIKYNEFNDVLHFHVKYPDTKVFNFNNGCINRQIKCFGTNGA